MSVEAAAVMLGGERTAAHGSGGGILTPAVLERPFIKHLRKADGDIQVETLHESLRKSV
jgi:hypothetical protein